MKISKYFSFTISAEEVGAPKPHEEIFLAALQQTKVDKHEFVYVGDDMVNDIDGAKNVGMTTVWKKNYARQLMEILFPIKSSMELMLYQGLFKNLSVVDRFDKFFQGAGIVFQMLFSSW